jgi:hypothetical protein
MVAANSRELLAALAANNGRPLSPEQVWRAVIGDQAPRGLVAENLGREMLDAATARLFQRTQAIFPHYTLGQFKDPIQFALARGVPFQTLFKAYQPGGRLGLADLRFGAPVMSSLSDYTPENAYGLVTDFGRREPSRDGRPSLMTIQTGEGGGFQIDHRSIPDNENVPGNPIFVRIMERCRSVCRSELQFQRVMQSLSQASTVELRMLAEFFPGLGLSEHSHFDTAVKPRPNGDVVVELVNGPDDRPYGAHIQVTVTPNGEASITDLGLEVRETAG